jgi:hypothetical protein
MVAITVRTLLKGTIPVRVKCPRRPRFWPLDSSRSATSMELTNCPLFITSLQQLD